MFKEMPSVLQDSAPLYTMVKTWSRLFQHARETYKDDSRPEHPVTIVNKENFQKAEKLVIADRRIKLW